MIQTLLRRRLEPRHGDHVVVRAGAARHGGRDEEARRTFFGGETILVTSGDGLHDVDVTALLGHHRRTGALATLAVKPVERPVRVRRRHPRPRHADPRLPGEADARRGALGARQLRRLRDRARAARPDPGRTRSTTSAATSGRARRRRRAGLRVHDDGVLERRRRPRRVSQLDPRRRARPRARRDPRRGGRPGRLGGGGLPDRRRRAVLDGPIVLGPNVRRRGGRADPRARRRSAPTAASGARPRSAAPRCSPGRRFRTRGSRSPGSSATRRSSPRASCATRPRSQFLTPRHALAARATSGRTLGACGLSICCCPFAARRAAPTARSCASLPRRPPRPTAAALRPLRRADRLARRALRGVPGRRLAFRAPARRSRTRAPARALVAGWKERGLRRLAAETAGSSSAVRAAARRGGDRVRSRRRATARSGAGTHGRAARPGARRALGRCRVVAAPRAHGPRAASARPLARGARANVRGLVPRGPRAGAHVALVDDVYTTGATVAAAATELRRAGARTVDVVTFARAIRGRRCAAGDRVRLRIQVATVDEEAPVRLQVKGKNVEVSPTPQGVRGEEAREARAGT